MITCRLYSLPIITIIMLAFRWHHFEVLYKRICRSPVGQFEIGDMTLIDPDLVSDAMEKVSLIMEKVKVVQSCQKSYSNVRR